MSGKTLSVILPIYNQADHIEHVVVGFVSVLEHVPVDWEMLLIPNGCVDGSEEICGRLSEQNPRVLSRTSAKAGWGNAVRHGLRLAKGEILCFTNSARTSSETLRFALNEYLKKQPCVVKVRRVIRDSLLRKFGSYLYNIENYLLFGLRTMDINGTPKIFPRSYEALLQMKEEGDLLDLEFNVICRQNNYRVVEPETVSSARHGGSSTTKLDSAWRMYAGAFRLWKGLR
jgi:glycosyltransferase involved in cell wall biosynthesis